MILPFIVLAYLSLFVFGLGDNMRGPLFPEILRHFGVSNSVGSWFYAISSFCSFLGSLLCLKTLKIFDRVQNLYISLIILAVGLVGLGFSQSFQQLLISAAIMGFGMGILTVSQNLLVAFAAHSSLKQRLLSGLHSMYGLSSLMAPLLVAGVYMIGGQWQLSFMIGGILSLALAVGGFIFLPHEKGEKLEVQESSKDRVEPSGGAIILAVGIALYVMAEILVSSRLALYLQSEKSYDVPAASFYVTGFFICLMISRMIFGFYRPQMKSLNQIMLYLLGSATAMMLGLYLHESFLMITGFFMGPFYPVGITFLSEVFPTSQNRVIAIALSLQSFFLVGMHLGSGWLADSIGVFKAMLLGPLCLLLSGIIFVGFSKWKKL